MSTGRLHGAGPLQNQRLRADAPEVHLGQADFGGGRITGGTFVLNDGHRKNLLAPLCQPFASSEGDEPRKAPEHAAQAVASSNTDSKSRRNFVAIMRTTPGAILA